jgi:hypothetical protein
MMSLAANENSSTRSANPFLLEAIDLRWNNYRAELVRCRSEFSDEAVHDY